MVLFRCPAFLPGGRKARPYTVHSGQLPVVLPGPRRGGLYARPFASAQANDIGFLVLK